MKKVDSNDGVWVNDDPATLTNGTPIDADFMNNIQDEISNVITDNGGTLDGTNHSQLSQTLDKTFAKLNSPTLTGIPLTSNPDGTINNQIATVDYVNQKALQATVGFTPVQQSGGNKQGANKVYIGADSTDATQARIQIDQTDLGKIVFQQEDDKTYGVSKFGYNHENDELAFYDTGNKAWHFSYTTDQIDAKAYISSLPDGNNLKVSDIIWNSSSSLPALYYGTDNSVAYLATETWAEANYVKSTPAPNTTNKRITDIWENADGRAVTGDGIGINVLASLSDLVSETSRAEAAESALSTAVTAESTARIAAVAGRVQRVNFIRFNTSGTYVASPNLLFAKIVVKGGGGGAGGMVGGGSGRASGGGGEGATSTTWYTAAQVMQSSGQVVVGAGGSGGVGGASGGVGGMSYVSGLHQAAGGQQSQGLSSGPLGTHGGVGGYSGSTGSAIVAGAPGGGGISNNTAYLCAGSGGGSGGGFGTGVSGTTYTDGVSGIDNTGGGGGGCVSINGTATGGSGGSGYVEITEYIGG